MNVLLFARARDLMGKDCVEISLPTNATVAELRRALGEAFPALRQLLAHSAIAVGEDYAKDDVIIPPNVDAAVVPPVSGG
ncbi:MAG: MoaD/ThiS family protein [Gemmataceae bacterium]|nr:MoaD/ThiS family protein [Gemmataceae bacterium]